MRWMIALAMPAVLGIGCNGGSTDPETTPTGLFGEWSVVRVCGGFGGGCSEPGGRLIIEKPDSFFVVADDGTPVMSHRFRLRNDVDTLYGTRDVIDVWWDDDTGWMPLFVVIELTENELRIGDNFADGHVTELMR